MASFRLECGRIDSFLANHRLSPLSQFQLSLKKCVTSFADSERQTLRHATSLVVMPVLALGVMFAGSPPATAQTTGSGTWTRCGTEGQWCTPAGVSTVRYGANGSYAQRTVTGQFGCASSVFGDPAYGTPKVCDVLNGVEAATWQTCAADGQTCSVSGPSVVRYGVGDRWFQRSVSASFTCGSALFGDPFWGLTKSCQVRTSVAVAASAPLTVETTGNGGTAGASAAGTWTRCGGEGATCKIPALSTVRYGASGIYTQRTVSGEFVCASTVFGDPAPGAAKGCDVLNGVENATWQVCASEGKTCSVPGPSVVRYGAGDSWFQRSASASFTCSSGLFGDAVYGIPKICEVRTAYSISPAGTDPGSSTGTGTGTTAGTGAGTGSTGTGTAGTGAGTATGTPPGEVPPSGNVFLVNRQSGMCAALASGQPTAGEPSVQTICRGNASETWAFANVGTGYQIRNLATGTCLYSAGGQTTNGPGIVQQPCGAGTDGGRWQIRKVDEWFEIVGIQSGRCLTVTNGSREDGAGLSQLDCGSAGNQVFSILPATYAPSAWTAPRSIGIVPVSAAALPSGKLLMWGADGPTTFGNGTNTWTTLYDPATDTATVTNVTDAGQNFCPGTNLLADGRLLVSGGRNPGGTSFYDPSTNRWSAGPAMRVPRGYNGNTTLSTGETLTYGGSWSGDEYSDKFGEVYSPSTGAWRLLSGVSGNAAAASGARAASVRDNHYWLFAASNGFAFNPGPSPQMFWVDTRGNGTLTAVGNRGDDGWSQSGTATMYDVGKIVKMGGAPNDTNQFANTNIYTIDIAAGPGTAPKVQKLPSDPFPRAFANSVVLPTGDVVTIGGHTIATGFNDSKSVMMPTIWSPATGKLRLLRPIGVPRNYHSWAVLMPDGRVVSGGGGLCACSADHPDFQFLTPPYLFDASGNPASRPAITSAPGTATVGTTPTLAVATDRAVASFALVRMGATTHTVNADQRRVPLAVASSSGTTYQLTLPTDRGILLPGPWMLFAMDANGVPSVAKIVRVQ